MLFSEVPGHDQIKDSFIKTINREQLSHAILLLGNNGSGTLPLALGIAQYLLCESKGERDSCGTCPSCQKVQKLIHPDLHFTYPVVPKKSGDKPLSTHFIEPWREIIKERQGFFTPYDWLQFIDAENKQGNITAEECRNIIKQLGITTFEGSWKIQIIWMPEYLKQSSNILLKLIEEPPANTLILLVAQDIDQILPTILSRTQITKVPQLEDQEVADYLTHTRQIDANRANKAADFANGNIIAAIGFSNDSGKDIAELFQQWISFTAKTDIKNLLEWIEHMSKTGREFQKNLILYGLHFFRECTRLSYAEVTALKLSENMASIARSFSEKITLDKLTQIIAIFERAHYHVERNGNPKLIFINMGIRFRKILDGIPTELEELAI